MLWDGEPVQGRKDAPARDYKWFLELDKRLTELN